MSNDGSIIENMDLSHIHLAVIKKHDFTVTHLANQHYATCWRRESGYCAVCYYPKVTIGTVAGNVAATQSSFGLS